jgi:hypothetical protein
MLLLYNLNYIHLFSTWDYLLFRVEPNAGLGYSLLNSGSIEKYSAMLGVQFLGLGFAVSGLIIVCSLVIHSHRAHAPLIEQMTPR